MTCVTLLAIDTATEACSAAISTENKDFTRWEVCPQQHSQKALPMVQDVMHDAGMTIDQVDVLVFGRGPGSFTGVRIATGLIQGLALGAEKPVVGVSTLAAMAQEAQGERIAVAIDARMGEVYYAEYIRCDGLVSMFSDECVIPPEVAIEKVTQFKPDGIAGSGWEAYPDLKNAVPDCNASPRFPSAQFMLPLARAEFEQTGGQAVQDIEPTYLRDKVTWKKLPGKE
ncbi:tRNA (adenosine(37)-N6)-threonylcarbamoyltransferase complex dimerization subunit type 1 TsaB [Alteromonas sediminis]|uniref:tRNA threonylcarbamoyladenosine biosynthesis protein TsaB n=1 Tax=Alteromonas sediminis TaxID=2259342 RepID=A0A3N5Y946_9ALTE|nr:tRNA (adenosine(37)-N6)-threonylcarbamoyltransferase complex dimerization subunit type 1 TsaB [Alteromonas sediminis]RPJ65075.1 tRNA (adenosine(37)-N6)-threonylcarbamoyltransferase complex dimerization subunit type 1 TsaB [Alteromonas sediminis]